MLTILCIMQLKLYILTPTYAKQYLQGASLATTLFGLINDLGVQIRNVEISILLFEKDYYIIHEW